LVIITKMIRFKMPRNAQRKEELPVLRVGWSNFSYSYLANARQWLEKQWLLGNVFHQYYSVKQQYECNVFY
jgi:hypothetical protein